MKRSLSTVTKLSDVPNEVLRHVLSGTRYNSSSKGFLTKKEKVELSLGSKSMFHLFSVPPDARFLKKFLFCIARGEQDRAEKLLKSGYDASKWLLNAEEFTDYSGRTFHCTAYEYAYWAKDTHMCRMLEQYMDEDTKAKVLHLIEEMERIDTTTGKPTGLTYQQHQVIHHSAHFDFTPLKQALKVYLGWAASPDSRTANAVWMSVGKAQRDVPAHVAQEYCRLDRSFYPGRHFDEPTLPRTFLFYNCVAHEFDTWFPLKSYKYDLGSDFAVIRYGGSCCGRGWYGGGSPAEIAARADLQAITVLDAVRSADLEISREHLKPRQVCTLSPQD